jgi:hypothetical protein
MTLRTLSDAEMPAWDAWLAGQGSANIRQLSLYRKALTMHRHHSEVVVLQEGSGWLAGALLNIRRPVPFLAPSIHTSGGIVLAKEPAADAGLLAMVLDGLLERCKAVGAAALDIVLRWPRSLDGAAVSGAEACATLLAESGFELQEGLETYVVPLDAGGEDALLQRFARNTRRDARRALRDGLQIERAVSPDRFDAFEEAHRRLTERKALDRLPIGFAREVLFPMSRAGQLDLWFASFEGRVRNWLAVGTIGMPTYTWGAVDPAAQDPGGPPTGQALHFVAMKHYASIGAVGYDLGGTPGPIPDASHPNYTVWRFKHGFGGSHVRFLGRFRRVLKPTQVRVVDRVRRMASARRSSPGR